MRALAKNRDDRQANVLEFLQEFTGYQDAQAAWTMATSSANVAAHSSSGGSQPRAPLGTPGPMPQSGQMHAAGSPFAGQTPSPYGAQTPPPYGAQTPSPFQAQTPSPYGQATPSSYGAPTPPPGSYPSQAGYPSGTMDALPSSGGVGKIFAVLVIALFVIGGGTAGGLYWWMQREPLPTPTPTPNPSFHTGIQPMEPTPHTPSNPSTPMVPSTPSTPTMAPATPEHGTVENDTPPPTMATEPEHPTPTPHRDPDEGNTGDPAGLAAAQQGGAALDRDDLDAAMGALSRAQRLLGRSHPQVRRLRTRLATAGGNKVGVLLIQGRCPDAQALYRRLHAVGAEHNASGQFADWCRRP